MLNKEFSLYKTITNTKRNWSNLATWPVNIVVFMYFFHKCTSSWDFIVTSSLLLICLLVNFLDGLWIGRNITPPADKN